MRKIYILIFIFVLLFIGMITGSTLISSNTVDVDVITPNFVDYNLTASASGTIKSSNKIGIKLDYNVVIKEYKVKIGDKVNSGDILFIIDKEKTIELLKTSYSDQEISIYQNYINSFSFEYFSNYDGVISNINTNKTINAGENIVEISSGSGFIASVNVLEKDITNIELGQVAEITGEALGDNVYNGKVVSIANEATKNNSNNKTETTINVILSVDDPDNKLKSGYNIKANIIYGKINNAITVPYETLNQDEKSYYVYKLYNNEFLYKSRVEVICEDKDFVVINGNIKENTIIGITNENLKENITRVNVLQKGIKY